jgi:hypothetical protein
MRVKRRAKLRRPGFEPQHRAQLLDGHDFFGDAYGDPSGHRSRTRGPFDAAAAREDWEASREELLAYWLQDPALWEREPDVSNFHQPTPGGPGSRPAAWWWFAAPEPRRIVARWTTTGTPGSGSAGLVEIPVNAEPRLDVADWLRLWREEPRWRHFYRGMRTPCPGIVDFETEREYLARLGLMSAAERAALSPEDPEHALDDVTVGYQDPETGEEDD